MSTCGELVNSLSATLRSCQRHLIDVNDHSLHAFSRIPVAVARADFLANIEQLRQALLQHRQRPWGPRIAPLLKDAANKAMIQKRFDAVLGGVCRELARAQGAIRPAKEVEEALTKVCCANTPFEAFPMDEDHERQVLLCTETLVVNFSLDPTNKRLPTCSVQQTNIMSDETTVDAPALAQLANDGLFAQLRMHLLHLEAILVLSHDLHAIAKWEHDHNVSPTRCHGRPIDPCYTSLSSIALSIHDPLALTARISLDPSVASYRQPVKRLFDPSLFENAQRVEIGEPSADALSGTASHFTYVLELAQPIVCAQTIVRNLKRATAVPSGSPVSPDAAPATAAAPTRMTGSQSVTTTHGPSLSSDPTAFDAAFLSHERTLSSSSMTTATPATSATTSLSVSPAWFALAPLRLVSHSAQCDCHVFFDRLLSKQGFLVSRIPFAHIGQLLSILELLRQQAMFNALLRSCAPSSDHSPLASLFSTEIVCRAPSQLDVHVQHPSSPVTLCLSIVVHRGGRLSVDLDSHPSHTPRLSPDDLILSLNQHLSIPLTVHSLLTSIEPIAQVRRKRKLDSDSDSTQMQM